MPYAPFGTSNAPTEEAAVYATDINNIDAAADPIRGFMGGRDH
jgi:hypothetical protein